MQFVVTYYDVWADGEGGWVGNYSVFDQRNITVPEGTSDRTIEREARAAFGFTGRRTIRDCDGCVTRWIDPKNAVAVDLEWGH